MGRPDEDLVSTSIAAKAYTDCFSFFYYIHGEGVNQIELDLVMNNVSTPLWIRKHSAGDMWHLNRVNIPAQSMPFKVRKIHHLVEFKFFYLAYS